MKVTCSQCKRRVRLRRGEEYICRCGNKLNYMSFFRKKISYVVYLLDANIFIYSENKKDTRNKTCKKILKFNSPKIKIGTTDVILEEIKENKKIMVPENVKIYNTGKISDELAHLRTNYLKQPSLADLSLVQAAIEHAEIKGIVTYDKDFGRIATKGVIQKRSSSNFWLGNARDFLKKYEIKSKVKKD
ncbi:MAG: type II toxin-antitoxin system VapC family toxin [Atribacterota bacterium]